MSAYPVHQDPDPRDPQVIHDWLPAAERPEFLREYRDALEAASEDIAKYKDLQDVLTHWLVIADALNDPRYREALERARTAETPGISLDEVAAMRRDG
ncbi:DUF6247 family protein [Actinomadura syzygii]|uniref:Uncharacterized protein n=1 Tax=Actinomadura syzygii TaxID=1427538 RepID=A0A5D0UAL3_9ACTN|nr:DUF6247 family protein [Actinomadura syzygii]TYC14695.1 hypothetical protein FXF65_17900 [Actinomadura syzygii]